MPRPPHRRGPRRRAAARRVAAAPRRPGVVRRAVLQRPFAWRPELLALLGKIPNRQLARKAGVRMETVFFERQRRGIAAYHIHVVHDWRAASLALLGTERRRRGGGARHLAGHGEPQAARARHPAEFSAPVRAAAGDPLDARGPGPARHMSDERLAARLHVASSTVSRKRDPSEFNRAHGQDSYITLRAVPDQTCANRQRGRRAHACRASGAVSPRYMTAAHKAGPLIAVHYVSI
jgi:hypothetical protein